MDEQPADAQGDGLRVDVCLADELQLVVLRQAACQFLAAWYLAASFLEVGLFPAAGRRSVASPREVSLRDDCPSLEAEMHLV